MTQAALHPTPLRNNIRGARYKLAPATPRHISNDGLRLIDTQHPDPYNDPRLSWTVGRGRGALLRIALELNVADQQARAQAWEGDDIVCDHAGVPHVCGGGCWADYCICGETWEGRPAIPATHTRIAARRARLGPPPAAR